MGSDSWFRVLVLLANVAATVTYAALNVDIAVIGDALSMNAFLLPDAYVVGVACTVSLTPTLLEAWGGRRLLTVSLCGLLAATLIGVFAEHGRQLGAALFLHGVFAAPVLPATQTLCATRSDDEAKRRSLGSFWMGTTLLGTLAGYTMGGWVAENLTWRLALLLCWGPALPALALARRLPLPAARVDAESGDGGVDVVSAVLLGGVMLTAAAIAFIGAHTGWAVTRGMRRMVMVLLFALVAYLARSRRSTHPILDLSVLSDRAVAGALVCTFLLDASSTGVFETEMLGSVLGMGPEQLAARNSLGGVSLLAGVSLANLAMHRLTTPLAACAAVLVLLAGKGGTLSYHLGIPFLAATWPVIVSSVGYGMLSTVLAVTACHSGDARRSASAAALYAVSMQIGASVGLAVFDAALQVRQDALLAGPGPAATALCSCYLQVFVLEAAMAALVLPLALAFFWRGDNARK